MIAVRWPPSARSSRLAFGLAAGAGLLGVLLLGSLVHYTRSMDGACQSCHAGRGEAGWSTARDRWHGGIPRAGCHAPHGELVPSLLVARPERTDEHCRRCHAEAASRTDTTHVEENPRGIRFSHKTHLEQHRAGCTTCHRELFHPPAPRASSRPTKVACLQGCHADADRLDGCPRCHEPGAIRPAAGIELSTAACSPCHWTMESTQALVRDRSFRHSQHAGAGVACGVCHLPDDATASTHGRMAGEETCQACHHRDLRGVPCEGCHRRERDWRNGRITGPVLVGAAGATDEGAAGGAGVLRAGSDVLVPVLAGPATLVSGPATPDPMVGLADCGDCHTDVAARALQTSDQVVLAACRKCHAEDDPPRDVASLLAAWQATHRQAVEWLGTVQRINSPAARPSQAERMALLSALYLDPSNGVHNPHLTGLLVQRARKLVALSGDATIGLRGPPNEEVKR